MTRHEWTGYLGFDPRRTEGVNVVEGMPIFTIGANVAYPKDIFLRLQDRKFGLSVFGDYSGSLRDFTEGFRFASAVAVNCSKSAYQSWAVMEDMRRVELLYAPGDFTALMRGREYPSLSNLTTTWRAQLSELIAPSLSGARLVLSKYGNVGEANFPHLETLWLELRGKGVFSLGHLASHLAVLEVKGNPSTVLDLSDSTFDCAKFVTIGRVARVEGFESFRDSAQLQRMILSKVGSFDKDLLATIASRAEVSVFPASGPIDAVRSSHSSAEGALARPREQLQIGSQFGSFVLDEQRPWGFYAPRSKQAERAAQNALERLAATGEVEDDSEADMIVLFAHTESAAVQLGGILSGD